DDDRPAADGDPGCPGGSRGRREADRPGPDAGRLAAGRAGQGVGARDPGVGRPDPAVRRQGRVMTTAYTLRPPSYNAKLTEVARGTPMGELLRRYWHPVGLSGDAGATPRP